MTAFSDYLESGLLHHIFRGQSFPKPTNIAIALCSGVPSESSTAVSNYKNGGPLPELPSGNSSNQLTGYARYNLGNPASQGNSVWTYALDDHNAGSGLIKNTSTILFPTALTDWGWVSGIAIVDSGEYGTGNMLMYAQLNNPRIIYQGDSVKFDLSTLQIKFR
jgi:hypothetical protein